MYFCNSNGSIMSYEQDNIKMKQELDILEQRFQVLKKYFDDNPNAKRKQVGFGGLGGVTNSFEDSITRSQYERILQNNYYHYPSYNESALYLEFKIITFRIAEIKSKLKESKAQRSISKTMDYIGSITPQHVSGRIYKVENGDGCGTFCLWFMVVDAIIVFLLWAFGVFN